MSVLVLDNGTFQIKAGFAGDDSPRTVTSQAVCHPQPPKSMEHYYGDEAILHGGALSLTRPIENRIITNWSDMTQLWNYIFIKELRVSAHEHPIILTESIFNPKQNREETARIMFEKFNVPAFYLQNTATLSLYATGRTTGLVLDSGHSVSDFVPISEGHAITEAIVHSDVGGAVLTNFFDTLDKRQRQSEFVYARDVKEKMCYVALDIDAEAQRIKSSPPEHPYELPDGHIIHFGMDLCICPEALFQPDYCSKETAGIHTNTVQAISKCPAELQKDMYSNIILSGGNTMFPGLVERLTKELTALAPAETNIKINAAPERKYLPWIGASILASLDTFKTRAVSRQEYDEEGPAIVTRKCV